jgi:hypothetical protein
MTVSAKIGSIGARANACDALTSKRAYGGLSRATSSVV